MGTAKPPTDSWDQPQHWGTSRHTCQQLPICPQAFGPHCNSSGLEAPITNGACNGQPTSCGGYKPGSQHLPIRPQRLGRGLDCVTPSNLLGQGKQLQGGGDRQATHRPVGPTPALGYQQAKVSKHYRFVTPSNLLGQCFDCSTPRDLLGQYHDCVTPSDLLGQQRPAGAVSRLRHTQRPAGAVSRLRHSRRPAGAVSMSACQ